MKLPPILFQSEVQVKPPAGETAYGPITGPAVAVKCRVIRRRRLVKATEGEDLISNATIQADADEPIELGAEITLDGEVLTAVEVLKPAGLNGQPTHLEVLLA